MARAFPARPDIPHRPDVASPHPPRRRRRAPSAIAALGIVLLLVGGSAGWVLRDRVAGGPDAPAPTPKGQAGGAGSVDAPIGPYRFLDRTEDGPLGWNPCRPIEYEVNLRDAPRGALRIVELVAARMHEASGFTFVSLGTTDRGPIETQRDGYLDWVYNPLPVLISWLSPMRFATLAPPRRAAAIGQPWRGRGPDFTWYTSGQIVVNTDARARPSFETRWDLGPVLLHEWGHVLGLAHVTDSDQIMWSSALPGAENPAPFLSDLGDGDRAGLARLAAVSCEAV